MIAKTKRTSDAIEIVRRKMGDDPEFERLVDEEYANRAIAQQIYDLRMQAGLTQKQLAVRIGTTQSVIARLEDADYEGHSLTMLSRIGAALGYTVAVTFVRAKTPAPIGSKTPSTRQHTPRR